MIAKTVKDIWMRTGEDVTSIKKSLKQAIKERENPSPNRPLDKRQNQLLWAYDRNVK